MIIGFIIYKLHVTIVGKVRRKMKRYFVLCSIILLVTGCVEPAAKRVMIYKSLGGIQCQKKISSLTKIRQELINENISVFDKGIEGDDGVARITVCGASTGEIGIFVINQKDLKKAKTLGFMQYRE